MAIGVAVLLTNPAAAQLSTTANGPYYAVPSWSQKLPTHRFVVLANWNHEAVLDRETGLVWQRAPDTTTRDWSDAQAHCNNLAVASRKGWRLPGIQELASLVDASVVATGPKLPEGHPFAIDHATVWSSTPSAERPTASWRVLLLTGLVSPVEATSRIFVWCVRGGQGAPVQ